MTKVAFISDVHGNAEALEAVLTDICSRAIHRIICLGDVASYNADQDACFRILAENKIEWLAGNHDLMAAGLLQPLECSLKAFYAAMRARRSLSPEWASHIRRLPLMLTDREFITFHASPYRVDEYLTTERQLLHAASFIHQNRLPKVAFFGHTHRNCVFLIENGRAATLPQDEVLLEFGKTYLVNVGTVGEPRDGDQRAAYTEFDQDTRVVRFHRVGYDYNVSYNKSTNGRWRMPHSYVTKLLTIARLFGLRLRHEFFPALSDDPSIEAIRLRVNQSDKRALTSSKKRTPP